MPPKGKAKGKAKGKEEEPEPEPVVEAEPEPEPEPESDLLMWRDVSEDDTKVLLETVDVDEQYKKLAEVLGFTDYEEDLRQGILMDFFFYNLQFAMEAGFSDEQTSAFFSIMKQTIEGAYTSPRTWVPMEESFAFFKELFLKHAVDNPPEARALYSVDDVQQITAFVTKSFYRHYSAYRAVFTEKQPVQLMPKDVVVETPLVAPPTGALLMVGEEPRVVGKAESKDDAGEGKEGGAA